MGVLVFGQDIVDVVGRHKWSTGLLREFEQLLVDFNLIGKVKMGLDFKVEVLFAKDRLHQGDFLYCCVAGFIPEVFGHYAINAGRKRNQTLGVRGEKFSIHARLVIKTL